MLIWYLFKNQSHSLILRIMKCLFQIAPKKLLKLLVCLIRLLHVFLYHSEQNKLAKLTVNSVMLLGLL